MNQLFVAGKIICCQVQVHIVTDAHGCDASKAEQ